MNVRQDLKGKTINYSKSLHRYKIKFRDTKILVSTTIKQLHLRFVEAYEKLKNVVNSSTKIDSNFLWKYSILKLPELILDVPDNIE